MQKKQTLNYIKNKKNSFIYVNRNIFKGHVYCSCNKE